MSVFGLGFGIISGGLMLLTAILITATLRIPSLAQRLLSVYLFAYAHLVLVTQITGLTYQLTQRLAWIALHLLFVGLSAWWWRRQGTPSLDLLQLPPRGDRHAAVARSLRRYPLLWTFSVAVAVAYFILFFLAVYVPPNNFDGFTYRLTRVAYWLQYDSLYAWYTADVRQVGFPSTPS